MDENACALGRERLRAGRADAARGAGDEYSLVREAGFRAAKATFGPDPRSARKKLRDDLVVATERLEMARVVPHSEIDVVQARHETPDRDDR